MRCELVCRLASVLCVSTFACALPMNTIAIKDLSLLLDQEQIKILDDIVTERTRLSFEGVILGLIAAMPIALLYQAWCTAALVLFITQSTYYHVCPKKKWMLNYLETREQVDQWLVVYKKMQFSGIMTSICVTVVYVTVSLIFKP